VIKQSPLKPANLTGSSDHRIVMALSLAGLAIDGQCVIDTAEAMNVTFPDFVNLIKSIGANMTVSE
jgi:3-phosphoshikimate 1-carboxyvinyltransferase